MRGAQKFLLVGILFTQFGFAQSQQVPVLDVGTRTRMALALSMENLPRAKAAAYKDWNEAAGINPAVQEAYLLALQAWRQDDFPGVVMALVPALQSVPDYPACLHLLGHAQFRMRRHEQCALVLTRLIRVAPQLVGRTRHLGHSLAQVGRVTEALAHYDRVLAAAPEDVQARRGRAVAHWRAGHSAEALEDLSKVVQSDPSLGEAWQLRATIWYDLEELQKAQVAVKRARALRPRDPEPAFLLAHILAELGQKDQARSMEQTFKELERQRALLRPIEGLLLIDPWNLELLTRLVNTQKAAGDRAAVAGGLMRLGRAARLAGDAKVLAWVAEQQEQNSAR